MATKGRIRTVNVAVKANISDFEKSMRTASKKMQDWGKSLKSIGDSMTRYVTLPIVAGITALTAAINKAGTFADDLITMSAATGISVEKLQELQYVASQTGASYEALTSATAKFTRSINEGLNSESDIAKVLDIIGIKAQDVIKSGRPMNEVLFETIKRIGALKDVNMQDIISSELFGRSFQDLLPWIRTTGEEYESLVKRARDVKLVKSSDDIAKLDAMGDKLAEIKTILQYRGMTFLENNMPTILKLTDTFEQKVLPLLEKFFNWIGKVSDQFNKLNPGMQDAILKIGGIAIALGPVISGFGGILDIGGKILGKGGLAGLLGLVGSPGGAAIATAAASLFAINGLIEKYKQHINDLSGESKKVDTTLHPMNPWMDAMKNGPSKTIDLGKIPPITTDDSFKKEMEDYGKWMDSIAAKWNKYVSSADKAASKTDELKNSIKQFVDALKSQTRAFADFTGLFDKFERVSISGERLLNRLKAQVKAMTEWRGALATLEKRGVSKDFLADLRAMGPSAVDSIMALSKMTDAQLKQYTGFYNQKYSIAGSEATKQMLYERGLETRIDKQINIYMNGTKVVTDQNLVDSLVKKLRLAGVKV